MDGFQKRLRDSIQLRLSLWLSVAIACVAMAAGTASFLGAYSDANELQDQTLQQVAALVHHQPVSALVLASGAADADTESNVIVQSLTHPASGAHAGAALQLAPSITDGLHTIKTQVQSYRVLVKTLPDGERIAVSQETRVRDEVAHDSAVRTVLPLLFLVPVLLVVVAVLVRRMFRPVTRLSGEIDHRSEQDLHPLPAEHMPLEIRPFVTAINRLLGRVGQASETQRRFIADAAHELRSPMTALSLQAERLQAAEMSPLARERLGVLHRGIERGRSLLEQLLSLARAHSSGAPPTPVSLCAVYRLVLEDLMPLAQAKNIDLGMAEGTDALVMASEIDLVVVVKNLVDNAIRYTPAGGRVDLAVVQTAQHVGIVVEDNGPGIAAPERQRVLDAFYRVLGTEQPGSGLGLSIVKTLVERLKGSLELGDATQFPHGLKITATLPKAA